MGLLLALGLAGLAVLALVFFTAPQQQALRAAPSGFDGLARWLNSNGLETRIFLGGWAVDGAAVGLAVIPLYDTQLDQGRRAATTNEEMLAQPDEYDLARMSIGAKISLTNSLIVLPKWRQGMRLTGLAHPVLLSDRDAVTATLRALAGPDVGAVRRLEQPFTGFAYTARDGQGWTAQLYIAQVFDGIGCAPILGEAGRMVMGLCPLGGSPDAPKTIVLSDPDLFNNHGLRLGDNAWIARDIIAKEAQDGTIYIDYSIENWFRPARSRVLYERSWADLARFFDPPFRWLWIIAGLAMALALWRGSCRFGPVAPEQTDQDASRAHIIAVQARLLRLTGQDGALLAAYVPARLAAVAHALFGAAHHRRSDDEAVLLRQAARKDPALAERLSALLNAHRGFAAVLPASAAIDFIDAFEAVLEQLSDDA
ncbi:MAG: hypothetical protein AAGC92_00735 [Pseudomonadota bacterium]